MIDPTFDASDFAHVRALIDVRLSEEDIPDSVINSTAFLIASEKEVKRLLKANGCDFDELEGEDDLEAFKLAVLLRTAAYMMSNAPQIMRQTVGQIGHSWEVTNWERMQANLLNRANNALLELCDNEKVEVVSTTAFATAQSGRGGNWG